MSEKIKVAESVYKGRKITIFIQKTEEGTYDISACTNDGMTLNWLPTMEQIILGALYNRSIEVEEYVKIIEKRSNRFAGMMDDTEEGDE
jgi:hypothetical protein